MCLTTFFIVSASTDFAAACGNGKLILEDKFATLDSAWEFTNKAKGEPGPKGLTAKVPPGKSVSGLNHSDHHKNFELMEKVPASLPPA